MSYIILPRPTDLKQLVENNELKTHNKIIREMHFEKQTESHLSNLSCFNSLYFDFIKNSRTERNVK